MNHAVQIAGATHRGKVRPANQDALLVVTGEELPGWCEAVVGVFDGVGGVANGGDASARVASQVRQNLECISPQQLGPAATAVQLRALLYAAHARLRRRGSSREGPGGFTTATIALVERGPRRRVHLASVGDSPVLRLRDGRIRTVMAVDRVAASRAARGTRRDGTLTQALGHGPAIHPHTRAVSVEPGDRLLVCSDGLTDLVSLNEIRDVLQAESAEKACQHLIDAAMRSGGTDNVTAIVISFGPRAGPRDDRSRSGCRGAGGEA